MEIGRMKMVEESKVEESKLLPGKLIAEPARPALRLLTFDSSTFDYLT
jgi:hypothetical protein